MAVALYEDEITSHFWIALLLTFFLALARGIFFVFSRLRMAGKGPY
ncbi:MAG: hypothetical protein H0V61_04545 [Chitinophagales bacterium]|nr:hypothetical protein [Chitinophagales bacterium]